MRVVGYDISHAMIEQARTKFSVGEHHVGSMFGFKVDLDIHVVGIEAAYAELERCGFVVEASMVREPMMKGELPTRRCSLFGRRQA